MDAYRIRELIEFAEQRSRDYSLSNAAMSAFRDTAAALRELMQRSQPPVVRQPEALGVADEAVPRYVCLKAEGSRYAYVNDTQESHTVKRYDIFRRYGGMDGWACATEHAASLNALTGERNG